VSPSSGFELLPVVVKLKLAEPTEVDICIHFNADGAQWDSCFDGRLDQLNYEKKYKLDAGNYQIWASTKDAQSIKRPVTVLESDHP